MSKFKRVIFLLADGARPDVLEELLEMGELPNIKKYLVDGGSRTTAVSAFPSTTGPAYMPFLTGCLPATCNVPGIRWLDRIEFAKKRFGLSRIRSYVGFETFLIGSDMRHDIATLFDLLPRSYNIFNSVSKGVSFWRNKTSMARIWYWYYAHLTDRWNFVDSTAVKKLKSVLKKDIDMLFMIFPGIDEYSHIANFRCSDTIKAYKTVDTAVATAIEGSPEDTLVWLIADHGLSVTHNHFCINDFLEARGIKTLYYPKIYRRKCVAANMVSGNGMSNIYLRHDHGWQYPMYKSDVDAKYPGLVEDLAREKAIDILAIKYDRNRIEVRSKRGSALIDLEGDLIKYQIRGGDPFGYENMKEEMTSDESLQMTMDSEYPDAIYQLAHLFTSQRCGDIVVSATRGFDLRDKYETPEHKGSHGSLHCEHMLVPLLTNAKIKTENVRTTDVFPTTMELLGHTIPANIDGRSLCV